MLADRTLLGATLLVTFMSGGTVGFMANEAAGPAPQTPYAVETVFAAELEDLGARGYSEVELREASTHLKEYLGEYRRWWDEFVESQPQVFDKIDERHEERMQALEERVKARLAGKQR